MQVPVYAGMSTGLPYEWMQWNGIEVWLHANAAARGQSVLFVAYPSDSATAKLVSLNRSVTVDWRGRKSLRLARENVKPTRCPLGWHKVDNLGIAGSR